MKVMVFIGIVYYQRLRHMVADKFQVSNLIVASVYFFRMKTAVPLPLRGIFHEVA